MSAMRKTLLLMLLSMALSLRLLVLVTGLHHRGQVLTPDSSDYLALATSLVRTGQFVGPGGEPEWVRTPGYPMLLASVMAVSGTTGLAVTPAALIAQVVLDVATVALVVVLATRLAGPAAGLLAGAIYATSAVVLAGCCRVLSDTAFVFVLTACAWVWVEHLRRPRWSLALLAAALLAGAAYIRPIALLLALPAGVVLLTRRWPMGLAFCGLFVAAVCPWVLRNGLAGGYWGFSAIDAVNINRYTAAATLARREGIDIDAARARLAPPADLGGAARYQHMRREGWRVVGQSPALAVGTHLAGNAANLLPGSTDLLEVLGLSLGQRGTLAVLRRDGLVPAVRHYFAGASPTALVLAAATSVWLAAVYLGLVMQAIRKLRDGMGLTAWLLLAVTLVLLLAPGPAGHPRFRIPAMGLIAAASASGWLGLLGRFSRPRAPGEDSPQTR